MEGNESTTIRIPKEMAMNLKKRKRFGESYADYLSRELDL